MDSEKMFVRSVRGIALPVTLQCLLQASFSMIDQLMIGQLGGDGLAGAGDVAAEGIGAAAIAGVGLAGKFFSVFSVLVSAVSAAAGIMIAQYIGRKDDTGVKRSFWLNLVTALILACIFMVLCGALPGQMIRLYTEDAAVWRIGTAYLQILAFSCVPLVIGSLLSTLLRCMEAAALPLYAAFIGAAVNTGLNYILIFGKLGFPKMGAEGAACATVISQVVCCFLTVLFWIGKRKRLQKEKRCFEWISQEELRQYAKILFPLLVCEFFWSLGENIYAAIYGHIGTTACAAMTLTIPVQTLFIGALTGIAQAAGILIGKTLGNGEPERARREARLLMLYGLACSIFLSVVLFLLRRWYIALYPVGIDVKKTADTLFIVYALIAPFKVQNMILGGGILRSGGRTDYVMWVDLIGTWIFGVPLGLCAAFMLKLPVALVYFTLSLEEVVRFVISVFIFKKENWCRQL